MVSIKKFFKTVKIKGPKMETYKPYKYKDIFKKYKKLKVKT